MTESEWLASEDPARMLRMVDGSVVNGVRVSDRKLRLFACACVRALHPRPMLRAEEDGLAEAECVTDGGAGTGDGGPFWWVLSSNLATRLSAWWGALPPPALRPLPALIRCIVGNPWRPAHVVQSRAEGFARVNGHVAHGWLTPLVLSLAQAAYEDNAGRGCRLCNGQGSIDRPVICGPDAGAEEVARLAEEAGGPIPCPSCRRSGRVGAGTLDPRRLAVLADALEEAGCPDGGPCPTCGGGGTTSQDHPWGDTYATELLTCNHCEGSGRLPHPVLEHLRIAVTHCRGCWALDLLLGLP